MEITSPHRQSSNGQQAELAAELSAGTEVVDGALPGDSGAPPQGLDAPSICDGVSRSLKERDTAGPPMSDVGIRENEYELLAYPLSNGVTNW